MNIEHLTREELISKLVDCDIITIKDGQTLGDYSYINDIMRGGFIGYDKFTDDELVNEYKESTPFLFGDYDDCEIIPEEGNDDSDFAGITEEELKTIRNLRRLTSMQWWNGLSPISQKMHTDQSYDGRTPYSLTSDEIEKMYYNQE